MEKIKRYNQILLAVFGSLLIVITVLSIVVFIHEMIITLSYNPQVGEGGVKISDSTMAEDTSRHLTIEQELTFMSPVQLDSGQDVYLIPVSQVNLEVPSNVELNNGDGALLNMYVSGNVYYRDYYGYYNNFILYDVSTGVQQKIFSKKVSLHRWSKWNIQEEQIICFQGATEDSNDDQILNQEDHDQLFIYHMKDRQLKQLEIKNATVINFDFMLETNSFYVRVGVDKNSDGEFDELREPYELYSYNVESRQLELMINPEVRLEIQQIIN